MKKVKIILLVVVLLIVTTLLLESCTEDLVQDNSENKEEIIDLSQVGKKLENPYKVATMKQAFKNLQQRQREQRRKNARSVEDEENLDETDFEVTTSHIYVKFKPTNSEEEAKLKQDSTLILSNLPLDYEFSEDELKKIESSASRKKNARSTTEGEDEEFIPEYYIAIPVEKKVVDGVPVDKLEELYIPEEDPYFEEVEGSDSPSSRTKLSKKQILLDQLLEEAFRIANNKPLETNSNERKNAWWIFGKKWYPSGRITRWDDVLQREVPVEGAQIQMRQWFTVRSGITDKNGNFSTGSVRGEARYIIKWERHQYMIRKGFNDIGAETRGPKVKRQTWNYVIRDGEDRFFAIIHQAAHHYYYKDIKGLKRPPTNSFWRPQMKIRANYSQNDDKNGSHQKDFRLFGIFARIQIYNPQNLSSEIYATTIHELAHASHWELRKNNWNDNNLESKVKESWARGVEWELTRMVYPSSTYKGRFWNTSRSDYTLVVADMIDGTGYNNENNGFFDSRDGVSGYTIKQIEDVLSNTSSWNDWKNNIKNRYNNPTENNLDKLFKSYE